VVCIDLDQDSQCDCIDLSDPPDGDCLDERVVGEISEAVLNNETQRTSGTQTVGPLGTDLWAR
jgi:hypothetical protein